MSTVSLVQARDTLDQAFRLLDDCLPFEDWQVVVNPDIAAYAIQKHGSLRGLYNDTLFDMCRALLMAYSEVQELEGSTMRTEKKHG
jgi:hypothetical protein